jgi:protocatechuate 3,4-dioxygenase beta subunit
MRKVVRNLAVSARRSSTRRGEREEKAARPDRLPSVDEILEREETRIKVARAVASLEEPYRSTILYRYFEGLPPREIATRLDVSVSAVNERLRRGLEKLRARLDRDFGERRSWCAALLPLVGRGAAEAAVGGPASASLLTGALLMSTKIKIAIAVIVAAGVTYAFWPRDEVKPPEVPEAQVSPPVRAVAEKKDDAESAAAKEIETPAKITEKRPAIGPSVISLEPAQGTIVGTVTDPHGAPIPNARVRALRFERLAVELTEIVSTRTDKRGRYILKPVKARCVVEARRPHHHSARRVASPFSRVDFILGTPGILKGQALLAETRAPCPGVMVAVYPWQPRDILELVSGGKALRYAWHRPPVAHGRTDRQGAYRIATLKPGRYQIRALSSDHPEIHTRDDVLVVRAGQETVRNLAITAGVAIVGQVTAESTGAPVSGAEVFLSHDRAKRAVTGPDGHYRLAGVGAAQALRTEVLVVRARGFLPALHILKFTSPFSREHVLDVVLKRGVILIGRVMGPDGEPVAGARVSHSTYGLRPVEEFVQRPLPYVTSDEEGRFTLSVRPIGRVPTRRLYASKEGLSWGASEPFDVRAGQGETEVVIRLGRGGAITGRVTDESDRPVESARVAVYDGRDSRQAAYTRADGRYEIPGVRAGAYDVKVVPPGLLTEGRSRFAATIRPGITVSEGGRSEIDLVLKVGPVLSGRVVDANGEPVPDVVVRAYPRKKGSGLLNPPMTRDSVTDARGEFRVEGLSDLAVPHTLVAMSPQYGYEHVTDMMPGRTDVLITLRSCPELRGRVLFAATGKPVPFFQLQVWKVPASGVDPPRRVYGRPSLQRDGLFADPEGRFHVRMRAGSTYEIQARLPDGQRSKLHAVEIPAAGDPKFLELRVWRAARLRGRVQTAQGKAVGSVQLYVYDLNAEPGKILEREEADSDGRFEFRSLPAGTFLLVGRLDMYRHRREGARRVELLAGSERDTVLTVGPGTPVAVRVTGKNGQPIEGAKVSIERADRVPIALHMSRMRLYDELTVAFVKAGGWVWGEAETRMAKEHATRCLTVSNPRGSLTGLTLIPGDYVVKAAAPGRKPWRGTIRIGAGGPQVVKLPLQKE